MTMRNRDMPAGCPRDAGWTDNTGLTKREAAAIANMAQILGSYGALPGETEEIGQMASMAVFAADALFDELEKGDG